MRNWFQLVDSMMRPARPHLARCLHERERHVAARRDAAEGTSRAIKECERRIVALREEVFAANDGFVGARMTDLERTWRRLSRVDPDAGLMDLWARIAPPSWVDQKRWRGNPPETQLDAAVLLAADVDGVEAAEAAARSLLGHTLIEWRLFESGATNDTDPTEPLLAATHEALSPSEMQTAIVERARHLEDDVHERARVRLEGRTALARAIGRAAFTDHLLSAAPRTERPNPAAALHALWKTGYVIAAIQPSSVTLEIPRHDSPR